MNDGLYLTTEQMNRIRLDDVVIVEYQDEKIHLCRCEPISNLDEFEVGWPPYNYQASKIHIVKNGKTLCGKDHKNWTIRKVADWINRCKMCERMLLNDT